LKEEIVVETAPGLSGIGRMAIAFPVPVLTFIVVPQLASQDIQSPSQLSSLQDNLSSELL